MANTSLIKRSSVASKVPTTSDLSLGELAVNTYDGKLFLKKSVGGTESIVDLTDADKLDGQDGSYYTGYTDTAISNLIDSSPAALNTLNELAAALNDDANFSTTVTNSIATKLPLAGGTLTGNLAINRNQPIISFDDTSDNPDYYIGNIDGAFKIRDTSNAADRLVVNTDGHVDVTGNLDVGAGLDVTGTCTATTFSGSGASLTNIPAAQLTGVLPALDGSNLTGLTVNNANTLDNLDSTQFVRSDTATTLTGSTYAFNSTTNQKIILQGSSSPYISFQESTTAKAYIQWNAAGHLELRNQEDDSTLYLKDAIGFQQSVGGTVHTIFHSGNDGSGSELDSDRLDGQQGNYYRNASNLNAGTIDDARLPGTITSSITGNSGSTDALKIYDTRNDGARVPNDYAAHKVTSEFTNQIINGWWSTLTVKGWANGYAPWQLVGKSDTTQNTNLYVRFGHGGNNTWSSLFNIFHTGNDGSGSGLDADTLDGVQASGLVAVGGDTMTGNLKVDISSTVDGILGEAYTGYFGLKHQDQTYGSEYMILSQDTHTFISASTGSNVYIRAGGNSSDYQLIVGAGNDALTWRGFKVWHGNNDGTGSGLDADTVDGIEAYAFVRSDASDTLTGGTYTFNSTTSQKIVLQGASDPYIRFQEGTTNKAYIQWNPNGSLYIVNDESSDYLRLADGNNGFKFFGGSSEGVIWHANNDGSGSGLDSDTLDGVQASSFLRSDTGDNVGGTLVFLSGSGINLSQNDIYLNARVINNQKSGSDGLYIGYNNANNGVTRLYGGGATTGGLDVRGSGNSDVKINLNTVWNAGNDGSGSGLDSDLLDGQHGSYYRNASNLNAGTIPAARLSASDLLNSIKTVDGSGSGLYADYAKTLVIIDTRNDGARVPNDYDSHRVSSEFTNQIINGWWSTLTVKGWSDGYAPWQLVGKSDTGQSSFLYARFGHGSNNTWSSLFKIWHEGVDGSGSGLDADLWDGNQFASYLNQALLTSSTVSFDRLDISGNHGIDNNGWYRNDASGEGLYNTATTQHFYSDDDDYWNIAGGTGANGLRFRDEHAGTIRGYVYANSSNQIGFLNQSGNWSLRTTTAGITQLGSKGYQLIDGNVNNNLYLITGTTGASGLSAFNSSSQWRWQLYGDGTSYGFLDANWGGWDIRKTINGPLKIRIDSSGTDHTVWCAGNDGSGSGLDADLLDGLQRTGFVENNNNSAYILRFGSGGNSGHTSSSYPYAIFQEGGAWSGSYPDLRINYHTGIVIAVGHSGYGGLRFQRDYNDTTELMSIGNGDNHVRVANNLYVSGDVHANGGAGAINVAASSDIRLSSGNWTGNAYGKIQHHSNALYIAGGSSSDYSIIFRYDGNDRVYIKSDGTIWPQADSSSDLGSSSRYWRNVYADTYYGDGSNLSGISSDLVNDSSPQLGGLLDGNGNTANFTGNTTALGLPRGSTAQAPTASSYEGYIRYDNDDNVVYYSDGAAWKKISSTIPILTTIDGLITNGAASTLTLTGSGFLAASLTVNFAGSGVNANVTVTASSNSSATVTVPAAAYNASAGTVIAIKVTNADGNESGTINKTNTQMPTGGNITTSGNYRIHTFTSSGTFGLTIAGLNVEYLVVAGGGGGGAKRGGGGGAGGMISGTVTAMSTGNKTVTVGGGGGRSGGGFSGGNSGNNSVFDSYTAQRGGSGGCRSNGGSGGSGGGNGRSDGAGGTSGGSGTSGQGNSGGGHGGTHGGSGGGGKNGSGGGGGNGSRGSAGSSAISGTNTNYAEGGQGGTVYGTGGFSSGPGANRPANTGHGADGGDDSPGYTGGAGGSGIVIVRYQL